MYGSMYVLFCHVMYGCFLCILYAYVCMYLCICVFIFVYIYVCVSVHVYACVYVCVGTRVCLLVMFVLQISRLLPLGLALLFG